MHIYSIRDDVFMDWCKGKSQTETIDFPMKIMGLKPVFFPLNQFIDMEVAVETSITTLPFFRSRC
jgi:hypothetical protein